MSLLFADKDELQAAVKYYHIKRNQTFYVRELDPKCWSVRYGLYVRELDPEEQPNMLLGYIWVV